MVLLSVSCLRGGFMFHLRPGPLCCFYVLNITLLKKYSSLLKGFSHRPVLLTSPPPPPKPWLYVVKTHCSVCYLIRSPDIRVEKCSHCIYFPNVLYNGQVCFISSEKNFFKFPTLNLWAMGWLSGGEKWAWTIWTVKKMLYNFIHVFML